MSTIAVAGSGLELDYGALVRHLAKLQKRISKMVAAHEKDRRRLETQLVRLRAERVVAITRQCWQPEQK